MRYIVREKFLHLGEDSVITNDAGQPIYEVDGKIFTRHHTLVMKNMAGQEVASIRQAVIALRSTWEVTRGRRGLAEVHKNLISFLGDRFTVDVPGPDDLEVKGNIFEHDYTISRASGVAATVSKRWVSLTATYGVDVAPGQDDVLILACVLILDLAEDERESSLSAEPSVGGLPGDMSERGGIRLETLRLWLFRGEHAMSKPYEGIITIGARQTERPTGDSRSAHHSC